MCVCVCVTLKESCCSAESLMLLMVVEVENRKVGGTKGGMTDVQKQGSGSPPGELDLLVLLQPSRSRSAPSSSTEFWETASTWWWWPGCSGCSSPSTSSPRGPRVRRHLTRNHAGGPAPGQRSASCGFGPGGGDTSLLSGRVRETQ